MALTGLFRKQVRDASDYIGAHWRSKPRFGVILGTGAGEVAEAIDADVKIPYRDVPHFPISSAIGHEGQFVCGKLAGQNVIAMQGRFHLYEGYDVDEVTLPVHVMAMLGVTNLLISNAAGGVNPDWQVGDVMLIDSHIDFMYQSTPPMVGPVATVGAVATVALATVDQLSVGRPLVRGDRYDGRAMQAAMQYARQTGFALYRGVYASMLGPNYETRAEYRFLRKIGADVVGMSTVPEVAVASTYAMSVMAMSIITNVANPDALAQTSGEDVVDAAAIAAPKLSGIVENAVRLQSR